MNTLSAQLITTKEELSALHADWDSLLVSSPSASIFLTWEWVTTWLETVYPEADLFVIVVYDKGGNLVAVAPFYLTTFTLFFVFKYKVLRFLGDCHSGMEYPDILVKNGFEDSALEQISTLLSENKKQWECAWFPNIASWTGSLQRLSHCFKQQELLFHRTTDMDFGSVFLPTTWNEYMQKFSRKKRYNLRRLEKKTAEKHKIQFNICRHKEDVEMFLDQLFLLHKKRWQMVGQEGAFVRRPLMVNFYRKMALCAMEKGWSAFFSLEIDGKIAASQYGYIYNGILSQIQEGFDPVGPPGSGNILRLHVLRWCIENGLKEYDFLGGYSAHKEQWKAEKRIGCNLFLGRKCLKNTLFSLLPIWPSGHYVNQGLPEILGRSHS